MSEQTVTAEPKAVKFSKAQVAFLREKGQARKDGSVVLTAELLSAIEPTGHVEGRVGSDEKKAIIVRLLETAPVGPVEGSKVLGAQAMLDAGLPTTFVTASAVWSGLQDGANIAWSLGYSAKHTNDPVRGEDGRMSFEPRVILRPITDSDRERRAKLEAKRAPAATPAPAAAATETPAEPATEPSGETATASA